MKKLEIILDKVEKFYHPKSVFLFGSRARGDYFAKSDYEIGVLFTKKNYINENEINNNIKPPSSIRVYPYEYERFIDGKINIPFQVNIFLREIIMTGITLRGEKIIEKIIPPLITVVDLMEDLKFSEARSSDAIVSYCRGDKKIATLLFWKSCLFGTRDLIIFMLRKFPKSYLEIYKLSKKLNLKKEYKEVINSAYKVRIREENSLNQNTLFKNISYLNKFIEEKIRLYYKKYGDRILI
jgi:predicted nucleotidyltransferase